MKIRTAKICGIFLCLYHLTANAQTPVITDFNPKHGTPGTPVIIIGSNLNTTSPVVYFGNVRALVDSATTNSVYTKVPVGAQFKKISVTVNGATVSTATIFKPHPACISSLSNNSFKPAVTIPIGSPGNCSQYVAIADLDGDGKPDLAVARKASSGGIVTVFKNTGTMGAKIDTTAFFSSANRTDFAVAGTQVTSIDVTDIDGDGKQDILVAGNSTAAVSILRNTSSPGTISFDTNVPISTSTAPNYATAADLNGDGKPELILVTGGSTSLLNIQKNISTPGTITQTSFTSSTTYALSGSGGAAQLAIDDIDGDGKLDIAVACSTGSTLNIFQNSSTISNISLATRVDITTLNFPFGIKLADMDGDNKPDLVYTRVKTPINGPTAPTIGPDSLIIVLRNLMTSPGTITASSFGTLNAYPVRSNPLFPEVADLDGDQRPELAAPNYLSSSIYILRNQSIPGTLNIGPRLAEITLFPYATCVAAGDLNGDNLPDVVVVNAPLSASALGSLSILENQKPALGIKYISDTMVCAGANLRAGYSTNGTTYPASTIFNIQLSDSNGQFLNPVALATTPWKQIDTVMVTIPPTLAGGNNYKIRLFSSLVDSCAPPLASLPLRIVSKPVVNCPPDTSVCKGVPIQLNTFISGANTPYLWYPSTALSDTSIASPVATPANTTTYHCKVSNSICSAEDSVKISVIPYPTAFAGLDDTICAGWPKTLSATGGSTYLWSPATGLSNINISNPIATPVNSIKYTVKVTSQGCSAYDTIQLTTVSPPAAHISGNNEMCIGSGLQLLASGGTMYQWTPANAISNSNIANPFVSPIVNTLYKVKVSGAFCFAYDSILIVVNALPVANAGADAQICSGDSVHLQTTGGNSYKWNANTALSNLNIADPIAKPTTNTLFIVEVKDTHSCINYDTVMVSVIQPPVANAGTDTKICSGDSVHLQATGGNSYKWNANTALSNLNIADPIAKPTTSTLFIVEVKDTHSCVNYDTVLVSVIQPPAANAGADKDICAGDSVLLTGSGGMIYSWSPSAGLQTPHNASTIANPFTSTTYVLDVSNGTCSRTDTTVVFVHPHPAMPTITQKGASLHIVSNDKIQWYYNGVPIQGANDSVYNATQNGLYSVKVTSIYGCFTLSPGINVTGISTGRQANNDNKMLLSVYPNPAKKQATLQLSHMPESVEAITIYNSYGITVQELSVKEQILQLDLSDYPKGLYFIYMNSNKAILKMIVE